MGDFKLHLYRDDHHLKRIGRCRDKILFWITSEVATTEEGTTDYMCTYRFMSDGSFIGCRIDKIGLRGSYSGDQFEEYVDDHIARLGEIELGDIQIYPFSIQHDGHVFGAVIRTEGVTSDDPPVVDLLPGYGLMFYEPWEEGAYDT